MPDKLNDNDFQDALLNCDVTAIKAVAEVESSGNGVLSDAALRSCSANESVKQY